MGFGSDAEAHELYSVLLLEKLTAVPDATSTATDLSLPHWVNANPVAGRKQVGGERRDVARAVLLEAGDLVGAVLMTNSKGVPDAAFRQVVSDQGALLG
ncbi:hypothetical protein C7M71_015935 [Peterkaempfera bronchialis]|uniref:Uncharacterized protein n=1 Tax=Peterkaempfera bronchialis TaxID=2126346 RepID=A0A345SY89_9ACTN|nr:hypothetical protein C7M71_015935 [Peterkaempfera bronchialis]